MMLFNSRFFLFVAIFSLSSVYAFSQHSLYAVGYREFKLIDSSRRYQPSAKAGDPLFYRPVQLDVWYPAIKGAGEKSLDYFYFLSLFERRANSFQTDTKYVSLAAELLKHFTIANPKINNRLATNSLLNTAPATGNFPVIIYMCAFNGMSYENVPLFEKLAQNGYYVIAISSVGHYPGNMTTRFNDALEQTKDAEFAINHLHNQAADFTRMGVIGYSYGGLSGLLLTKRRSTVTSFLSLDGSEKHYYGRDKQEDQDFDSCRILGDLKSKLTCTYAYLESDNKNADDVPDSVFKIKASYDTFYSRLAGAVHEDFSCLADLGNNRAGIYSDVLKLSVSYFDQTLKGKSNLFNRELDSLTTTHKAFKAPENIGHAPSSIVISGKILTADTHLPVSYVNIGIPSDNVGTVSNEHGLFVLKVADSLKNKIVRISSIGYQPVEMSINDLAKICATSGVVMLKAAAHQLAAITISAAKPVYKIIGNTSRSKFFNVGFGLRDLGSEMGIMINLGKHKVLLQAFNYHISQTRMDSCTFRLNIYSVKDGVPAENLLSQNILSSIGKQPGDYIINLKPYAIELNGEICVSLEWIAGKTSADRGAVFFSGGLLSSSYHRKTAQADWEKFKGLGASFHLKVEKL